MGKGKEIDSVYEDESQIKHEISLYIQAVECINVHDAETFEQSADALVELKRRQKTIKDFFKPLKEATHKAHKEVTTREKETLAGIEHAESLIRGKRTDYKAEQDKIAAEEQRLLEEKERKRVAEEQEKTLEEAAEAETPEQQEELLEKAEETVAQPVFAQKTIEKTAKVASGGSTTWVKDIAIEIKDIKLLCAGISSGAIPESVVQFSPGKLKTWVKTMNIRPGSVPGLFIKETQREVVRA
jgi:hypothetical protein